jgi:hypothetical protein
VATLGNPKNDVYRATYPVEIPTTAPALGLHIQVLEVSEPAQIEGAIGASVLEWADALHDFTQLLRRAATPVDQILKRRKPAELPVEQPTKHELVGRLGDRVEA